MIGTERNEKLSSFENIFLKVKISRFYSKLMVPSLKSKSLTITINFKCYLQSLKKSIFLLLEKVFLLLV